MEILDIPAELLQHHVFPLLQAREIAQCARVCGAWWAAVQRAWSTLDFAYVRGNDWCASPRLACA